MKLLLADEQGQIHNEITKEYPLEFPCPGRSQQNPEDLKNADEVTRPAILWNDGRTARQVDYLNNKIGKEKLSALTANIAFYIKENCPSYNTV